MLKFIVQIKLLLEDMKMKKIVYYIPAIIFAVLYGLLAISGVGDVSPVVAVWLALFVISGILLCKNMKFCLLKCVCSMKKMSSASNTFSQKKSHFLFNFYNPSYPHIQIFPGLRYWFVQRYYCSLKK